MLCLIRALWEKAACYSARALLYIFILLHSGRELLETQLKVFGEKRLIET